MRATGSPSPHPPKRHASPGPAVVVDRGRLPQRRSIMENSPSGSMNNSPVGSPTVSPARHHVRTPSVSTTVAVVRRGRTPLIQHGPGQGNSPWNSAISTAVNTPASSPARLPTRTPSAALGRSGSPAHGESSRRSLSPHLSDITSSQQKKIGQYLGKILAKEALSASRHLDLSQEDLYLINLFKANVQRDSRLGTASQDLGSIVIEPGASNGMRFRYAHIEVHVAWLGELCGRFKRTNSGWLRSRPEYYRYRNVEEAFVTAYDNETAGVRVSFQNFY